MRLQWLGVVLVLAGTRSVEATPASTCSVEQSKRAFGVVDKLNNWESVRLFYRTYLPCDDGGIAEGVSDAIAKLLADKWTDFWRLRTAIGADHQFQKFVLRHIDATVPIEARGAISQNARQRCPKDSPKVCKNIDAAALSAIKESQQ